MDLMPTTTTEMIPPAMELIDAMIRLEDIVHEGIMIAAFPRRSIQDGDPVEEDSAEAFDVT
jgi:hypothetical protein